MAETLKYILYAEDEPDIKEIAKISLEDVGQFKVQYCKNGLEVIKVAKENKFIPDLILLDVMMPQMDGPMALKELRKIPGFEHIPVIFMTAKIQPHEIANYKSMGVVEVITKPFDPMSLPEVLRDIWNQYKVTI